MAMQLEPILEPPRSRLSTSWGVALWIIAIAATLYILNFASAILLPTAFALVLSLVLAPIARALSSLRLNDGLAAVLTVLMAAMAIVAIVTVVAPAIGEWMQNAPKMARAIDRKLQPLKDQLQVVEDVSARLSGEAKETAVVASGGLIDSFISVGANVASQTIYVLFLTLFLLSLRTDMRRRIILCSGTVVGRIRLARAVRDVGKNVAAYLFILTCINAGVAIVTAIAFYAAGIPNALVWGAVYGLANYVPVIGPTGTIVAAAVVGIATEPTLLEGMMGAGIMLVINAIESQAVQPWLMARRIEINPVALFVALAFVVWLWGVPAAIIAAPLLIVVYTFSKHTPALAPIASILAPVKKPKYEPPPPPLPPLKRRKSKVLAEPNTPGGIASPGAGLAPAPILEKGNS